MPRTRPAKSRPLSFRFDQDVLKVLEQRVEPRQRNRFVEEAVRARLGLLAFEELDRAALGAVSPPSQSDPDAHRTESVAAPHRTPCPKCRGAGILRGVGVCPACAGEGSL